MVVVETIIDYADDYSSASIDVPSGSDIDILPHNSSTGLSRVSKMPL